MEESPFGKRVLHSESVVAMLMGLIRRKGFFPREILEFKGVSAEYNQPLYVGESMKGAVKVQDIQNEKGGCIFEVHKETGEHTPVEKCCFIKTGEVQNPYSGSV